VLSALLEKYKNEGINELEDTRVLDNAPFDRIGSPTKIANLFGGREQYITAVNGMKELIYAVVA
jgi:type I restriction enzyme, R subunit